jgi:5-methylcytosine-specific restriction endonuclease McrA
MRNASVRSSGSKASSALVFFSYELVSLRSQIMPRGKRPPEGQRWCSVCGQFRQASEFGRYPNALCHQHYREYDAAKQKRQTELHPGRHSKTVIAWNKAHPDRVKDAQRKHGKKLVSSGRNVQKHRERFDKNPEKMRAYWRKAYKRKYAANPLYFYYRSLNRRSLRKNAEGLCTRLEVEELLQSLDKRCLYCGAKATTLDHIVPLHHGGTNYIWNIAPACRSCNAQKGTKDAVEFALKRGVSGPKLQYVAQAINQHQMQRVA